MYSPSPCFDPKLCLSGFEQIKETEIIDSILFPQANRKHVEEISISERKRSCEERT